MFAKEVCTMKGIKNILMAINISEIIWILYGVLGWSNRQTLFSSLLARLLRSGRNVPRILCQVWNHYSQNYSNDFYLFFFRSNIFVFCFFLFASILVSLFTFSSFTHPSFQRFSFLLYSSFLPKSFLSFFQKISFSWFLHPIYHFIFILNISFVFLSVKVFPSFNFFYSSLFYIFFSFSFILSF